jgi:hypothetical protein
MWKIPLKLDIKNRNNLVIELTDRSNVFCCEFVIVVTTKTIMITSQEVQIN